MTSHQIEQEIQAKGANVAPRITPADVEANIVSERYFTARDGVDALTGCDGRIDCDPFEMELGLVTFCVIILRNGTKLVGVNEGPVSPANFDAELGRKLARQKAVDQIWPLMGYELRSKLAVA